MLENFEPNLYFAQLGMSPISEAGASEVVRPKFSQLTLTPSQAQLTDGVTPNATDLTLNTIYTTSKQYGIYCTITDVANARSIFNLSMHGSKLV